MAMMTQVTDNTADGRYELTEQGETAYADYHRKDGKLMIDYVFSPPALRGQGTSGRLMTGMVADAEARGETIVPICGYAVAWMKRRKA